MKQKMRDIPKSQRPYERCMEHGPKSLSDSELLAVIIRTGSKELNSAALADKILKEFKGKNGLAGLLKLTYEDLSSLHGIGPVKAIQILCIAELSRRIWKEKAGKKLDFSTPESIADFYMEEMRHRDTECALCICVDMKKRFLGEEILSTGSLDETIIHPREVFKSAIQLSAAGIILLHNHPSGDVNPSSADIATTRRIYMAGKLLGISLLDHLIIGDRDYYSLFESENWRQISATGSLFR